MNIDRFYRCALDPGHVVYSQEPSLLSSVCGSGVVVTVWDRSRRVGGMIHCVSPKKKNREKSTNYHMDVAIPSLMSQFLNEAAAVANLEAQIFGGGNHRGLRESRVAKTVEVARRMLRRFRIPIVSEDVGGRLGRKIMFNTHSGDAMVMKTRRMRLIDWSPEYLLKDRV